ncbi:MAG TPA: hypothetical protein VLV86_19215 [Vicinamibacterales bacterium]|nr:hypothetical protein [Vicinamibacterales bacterium]
MAVGTLAGATAAVWSLRQPSVTANVAASPAAASAATAPVTDGNNRLSPSTSLPKPVPSATPSADDDEHVLQQARALALRPDVTALMALRDDVARRATERGTAGSTSIKEELGEIDLRLNEARLLQLKLDAQEMRKAATRTAND